MPLKNRDALMILGSFGAILAITVAKLSRKSNAILHSDTSIHTVTKTGIVSVVIPAYNEESSIQKTLTSLEKNAKLPKDLEIIIVDAGCTDKTMQIIEDRFQKKKTLKFRTTASTSGGRGPALNQGASIASGDLFLFLHADTTLPNEFDNILRQSFKDPKTMMTSFRFGVDRKAIKNRVPLGLSMMEFCANLRSRYLWLPYGDQAFCIAKDNFKSLGGFPNFPCMEDYEFVRRAGKKAKENGMILKSLDHTALCSPRRWEKNGVLKNTALNYFFVMAYHLGFSPHDIFYWYYGFVP